MSSSTQEPFRLGSLAVLGNVVALRKRYSYLVPLLLNGRTLDGKLLAEVVSTWLIYPEAVLVDNQATWRSQRVSNANNTWAQHCLYLVKRKGRFVLAPERYSLLMVATHPSLVGGLRPGSVAWVVAVSLDREGRGQVCFYRNQDQLQRWAKQ
jgi:hypothetical protein